MKNNADQKNATLIQPRSKMFSGFVAAISYFGVINMISAEPVIWVEKVAGGEVRFYDWGYQGPDGRLANDFSSVNGFNGATQIQHVVTTGPDGLTPDAPQTILNDLEEVYSFYDSNMDSQTNFYNWGYTTTAGSTFNNMQIDSDGDYLIKREDMTFNYYGSFDYQQEYVEGSIAQIPGIEQYIYMPQDGAYATNLGFQPYALSDATGWCGSVTASNPGALEAMAGQVQFDFGFEAYFPWTNLGADGIKDPGEGAFQIIQDFSMRSYGSVEVDVSIAAPDGQGGIEYTDLNYSADAVVNNTNPLSSTVQTDGNGNAIMIEVAVLNMDGTPALDLNGVPRTMMVEDKRVGGGGTDVDFFNEVSFMGGGVVPSGVWVRTVDPSVSMTNDNILEVLDADDGNANTVWWSNSFAGYPFLLRADGIRVVDALDMSLYNDYCGIPGAICDTEGNFIGADASAPGSAFNANGELINLEGTVVQNLSAVPVPAAVWLFGSGLIGLIGIARRKK